MATRMQQRRGTAEQWTAANPVLAAGEFGFETDTSKFKVGDGVNAWGLLEYFINEAAITVDIGGAISDTEKGVANGVASLDSTGNIPVAQLGNIIDGAPAALNTLNEIAQALDDDSSFATTIVAALGNKVATGTFTTHTGATTSVHGIADTALLADKEYADEAAADAQAAAILAAAGETSTAIVAALGDFDDSLQTQLTGIQSQATTDLNTGITNHNNDTTSVHGIADTALLSTKAYAETKVSDHSAVTTSVHGIADTSLLALKSEVAAVTKTTIGLGNVDNTADTAKPVSTAQATAIATAKSEAIADATAQVNAVIASAPAALNTLDELAAALGDDANYAATITTALAGKVASYTPIIAKTASYTLSSLTERDSLIEVSSASATTITIPTNASVAYPIGTSLDILQTSTGQVTIAGAGGVTVNATPGLKLRTQWSSATLFKRAENTWVVMGDLSA